MFKLGYAIDLIPLVINLDILDISSEVSGVKDCIRMISAMMALYFGHNFDL